MLDAHQINVFLVAAETLNFTHAAQRLNMSQPSVSQHIQSLEQHFNIDLFLRAGRTIKLTDAGKALVPLARDLISQSVLIEESMTSMKGDIFGELRVGCSTTPGKYVLPHLLTQFHHQFPKVVMRCQVFPQAQAVEALCSGDVHFALTSFARKLCKDAEFSQFLCDPVVLIAPADHPWAQRDSIQADELLDEGFIMREEESGTYKAVQKSLDKVGIHIQDLNTFLTLGNSEAIAIAAQEGLGVGFVSYSVATVIGKNDIAIIKIEDVDICRDIYIGRHTRLPATKAQGAFWDYVTNLETISYLESLPLL